MSTQDQNGGNENLYKWLSSFKVEVDDTETNDGTGAVCSNELTNVVGRIKQEIVDANDDEYRALAADNEEFIADNEEFIADNEEFIADNEEFIADNEEFIADNEEFIADNEEFISDNEELIVEDEIIAENEVLAKDDVADAQIYNSSSISKAKFPSCNELEYRSGRKPYSINSFSSNEQKNPTNCCIDLQRGIIILENNSCITLGQDQKENVQETSCILYDDTGNEKIVPILQLEDLDHQKGYSSSRSTRFLEYAKLGRTGSKVPQTSDCAPEIKFKVQDSTPSTSRSNKVNNNIKRYQCDKCPKACVSLGNLKKHMKRHDDDRHYYCPHCEFKCLEKIALVYHIKRHLGVKPHLCTHSDYKTDNISNLVRHLRVHNGEKPIYCLECEFRCADTSSLRIHVKRKHTSEKPHKCHHCDYRSLERASMIRHSMMHKGERPFHCFFCSFRYIRFYELLRHLKRYDGTMMECGFCPFKSFKSDDFNNHLKANHRENWVTLTSEAENKALGNITISTKAESDHI